MAKWMTAAAGVSLAAWTTAGAQDIEALAERYGALHATTSPDVSPDGRHLARQVAHDGRYVLRIEGVDGADPVLWAPTEDGQLHAFHWTGDGNLLVVTTELAATTKRTLDPEGRRYKRYVDVFEARRPKVLTPRGKTVASLTFKRLGQIDVFQPLMEPERARGTLPAFIGTENGAPHGEEFGPATVRLDKNRTRFEDRPVEGSGYYTYSGSHDGRAVFATRREIGGPDVSHHLRTGGRWRRLDELALGGWTVLGIEDPDTLLVASEAEGGLHLFGIAANAMRETLHPGPLAASPIRRPADGAIIAVASGDEVVFLDEEEAAIHEAAEAVIGAGPLVPLDASHDGSVRLYSSAARGRPARYHVYDAEAGQVVRTLTSFAGLVDTPAPDIRRVAYEARDGLPIEGFYSTPAEAGAGPAPLIVMPHGGPASRDTDGFDSFRDYLTALGYAVFQPNFRGSTGYGAAFEEAGVGEWGAGMQTDIADGVAALVAAGDADPDRLAILGWSYGGYAALMGTLDETPYRCAVAIAAPTDLLGMLDTEQTRAGFDYWARHIGRGVLTEADFAARSPLRRAAEIDAPVLLIHGGLDHVVRKGQSAALEAAIEEAGGDVRALYLMESGHSLEREPDRVRAYAEAGRFLRDCLPPDGP